MPGVFETATRAAIEDLISQYGRESKYGYLLTFDNAKDLADALLQLLVTSRNLKSAGDRILGTSDNKAKEKTAQRTLLPLEAMTKNRLTSNASEEPILNQSSIKSSARVLPEGVPLYRSRLSKFS